MPSWFSKVFKSSATQGGTAGTIPPPVELEIDAQSAPPDEDEPQPRRVVRAPLIMDEADTGVSPEDIRIKARQNRLTGAITFLLDRPVFEGHSCWCPDAATARLCSPLASALFDLGTVENVLLHDTTITVTPSPAHRLAWEEKAREMGAQIRAHLKSGMPIIAPEYLDRMPGEEEVRAALERVIEEEINPGIAGHSGYITLTRVVGNTAYIQMGGGCQGCAASSITLRQGVERTFREAVPMLGALLDETDHTAGVNPYFTSLPVGM
jgi:Fe-S cluster biogenesis protein NfuA